MSGSTPTPIHFAPGSYGAVVNGYVSEEVFQQDFVLEVSAGQTMIITFTGAGPMRGGVSGPGGVGGDGPYYGTGNTFAIPTSGLWTVYAGVNTMAGAPWTGGFTLAVLVANP
jgi:hypothetical protein